MFIKCSSVLFVIFAILTSSACSSIFRVNAGTAVSTDKDIIIEGGLSLDLIGQLESAENWNIESDKAAIGENKHLSLGVSISFDGEESNTFLCSMGIFNYNEKIAKSYWSEDFKEYEKAETYGTRFSIGLGQRFLGEKEPALLIRFTAGMFKNAGSFDTFIDFLPEKKVILIGIRGSIQGVNSSRKKYHNWL